MTQVDNYQVGDSPGSNRSVVPSLNLVEVGEFNSRVISPWPLRHCGWYPTEGRKES